MTAQHSAMPQQSTLLRTLAPIMLGVFIVFLIIGMALPVLPLHVQNGLGFGPFAVGIVAGSQFAASLFSRIWAGRHSDKHGGKRAVTRGLFAASLAGCIYLASLAFTELPSASLVTLVLGRAVLGGGESFVITGALAWALGLAEEGETGKVISWVGTAMYAAFALGAPVGSAVFSITSFHVIAGATILLPLVAYLMIRHVAAAAPAASKPEPMQKILQAIWMPGVGLALTSIGFGAMTAFSTLLFVSRDWEMAWLPFSLFAASFILMRILLGSLPDRMGGAKVALIFIFVEAAGLALIWLATAPAIALLGSVLVGVGYSLVYPGFGIEAVSAVDAENRGLAMGIFTAFLDLALGIASPALGMLASLTDLDMVFLISAVAVGSSALVAATLLRRKMG